MENIKNNRSFARLLQAGMILGIVGSVSVGCKSSKKKPAAPPPATQTQPAQPVNPQPPVNPAANGNQQSTAPKITASSTTSPNLEFQPNQTVRLQLGVEGNNVSSNQYEFSLARMPVGAQLLNRNSASPELVWNSAAAGSYDVQVIARNMANCRQILGAQAAQCSIPASQFGNLTADPRFDLVQNFQIKIAGASAQGQNGNGGFQNPYANNQGGNSGWGQGFGNGGYGDDGYGADDDYGGCN